MASLRRPARPPKSEFSRDGSAVLVAQAVVRRHAGLAALGRRAVWQEAVAGQRAVRGDLQVRARPSPQSKSCGPAAPASDQGLPARLAEHVQPAAGGEVRAGAGTSVRTCVSGRAEPEDGGSSRYSVFWPNELPDTMARPGDRPGGAGQGPTAGLM